MTEEVFERQRYLWNTGFHFGDWLAPGISVNEHGDIDPVAGALCQRTWWRPAFSPWPLKSWAKSPASWAKKTMPFITTN